MQYLTCRYCTKRNILLVTGPLKWHQSAYQVYTIRGYVHDDSVPLLWDLLPNKTTASYKELFAAVRNALQTTLGGIGQMRYLLCDFEMAAINAVSFCFP